MTRAIILAAGRGSRMGCLTHAHPKGLIKVKGAPLIQYPITALRGAGITDIGIVSGYKAEKLKSFGTRHFFNPHWSETNMVYSLTMAKEWLEQETCIVSYSDILYSTDAVKRLLAAPGDIVITYDPHWRKLWEKRFEDPLSDAETFQLDEDSYLKEIGLQPKTITEIQGQYMGLLKITPFGWQIIIDYLNSLSYEEIGNLSMTRLLGKLIDKKIYATPIKDEWYEIDSETDLVVYQFHSTILR